MASKRRISFQWKVFLPVVVCMWIVIFGTLKWQVDRVRTVRREMIDDQLSVIGARLVELYDEQQDSVAMNNFAKFANKFYDDSEHYDPLNIWFVDINTDSVVKRVGNTVLPSFKLPKDKFGSLLIPKEQLNSDFDQDTRFIYSMHVAPFNQKKIYLLLPYTKRMQEIISSRTTYFWLVFVVIGILATIVAYVTTAYFGRSLKLLNNFAKQASTNPNFVLTDDVSFPHNELGDISMEIIKIYNQRTIEVERREKEHRIAMNAVEEKKRIKRDLTGNINHELKTPVGVIQGYIDTIIENPDMDKNTQKMFLLKVQQNVHRLSQLIADITAITKLESGGKLVNITEIDFHDLVFSFADELEENGVLQDKMTFTYEVPLNCHVLGNDSLLNTMLLNLVKNSVAYSEGTMCRLIMTKEDDDFYYFSYYDNGIGVPAEHLPHMFERFYRVNSGRSRTVGGTGLGLSIVEVTVTSLGGQISVMNHFPTGLEFDFSLPKFKKKASQSTPDDPAADAASSDANTTSVDTVSSDSSHS